MSAKSNRKGRRAEYEVMEKLREGGLRAFVHGMGAKDDITAIVGNQEWVVEVKRRADGFKQIYEWLDGKKLLFMRADNEGWLVTGRAEDILPALADYFERAR